MASIEPATVLVGIREEGASGGNLPGKVELAGCAEIGGAAKREQVQPMIDRLCPDGRMPPACGNAQPVERLEDLVQMGAVVTGQECSKKLVDVGVGGPEVLGVPVDRVLRDLRRLPRPQSFLALWRRDPALAPGVTAVLPPRRAVQ